MAHEKGTCRSRQGGYLMTAYIFTTDTQTRMQEVIQLLDSFRGIMRHNFETIDVNKIQERW